MNKKEAKIVRFNGYRHKYYDTDKSLRKQKRIGFVARLTVLQQAEHFTEDDAKSILLILKKLIASEKPSIRPVLEHLSDFRRDVLWTVCEHGESINIGFKEVGYDIRLACIEALCEIGNYRSIKVIRKALDDPGDRSREFTEGRWLVYRDPRRIKEVAKKALYAMRTNGLRTAALELSA